MLTQLLYETWILFEFQLLYEIFWYLNKSEQHLNKLKYKLIFTSNTVE